MGDVLFVPLVSWYQDGRQNPYGVMVEHFFVRCEVLATRGNGAARVVELYDSVSDVIYNNLDGNWLRRWGQHHQLPEGGIELTQDHIDLYEHNPRVAEDQLSDETVSESENDDGLARVFQQAHEEHRDEVAVAELPPHRENYVELEDEAAEIERVEFHQMLVGRRGWLSNMVGLHPDEIVLHLTREMLLHVVDCFNLRREQERLANVKALTLGEFMVWHSLRMFMCLQKLPSIDAYWKKGVRGAIVYPNFGKYMLLSRFRDITKYLRFEDYARAHDRERDPAWRIRTVTNIMKSSFQNLLSFPRQFIAVDEGMVKYTGRKCPIKRVMPNKPIACGFKFFAAVDCSTGIMFDFDWDDGRRNAENCRHHPWGFSGEMVLSLIRRLPGRGYVIVTDNYYTSVPLARELLLRGHRLLGTIRADRGVPAAVKLPSKKPTRICPKGTVRSSRTADNRIYIFSWMDNGPVYLLDTVYGAERAVVTRRDGRERRGYEVPKAFGAYNTHMGGVDRFDQIRTGFYGLEMHHRCTKWTVRAYESMFNMALANAFAVFRHFAGETGATASHHDFLLEVASKFLRNVYVEGPRTRGLATPRPIANRHTLKRHPPGSDSARRAGNRRKRRCCVHCRHAPANQRRTSFFCVECGVSLHPQCDAEYHSQLAERGVANGVN